MWNLYVCVYVCYIGIRNSSSGAHMEKNRPMLVKILANRLFAICFMKCSLMIILWEINFNGTLAYGIKRQSYHYKTTFWTFFICPWFILREKKHENKRIIIKENGGTRSAVELCKEAVIYIYIYIYMLLFHDFFVETEILRWYMQWYWQDRLTTYISMHICLLVF